MGHRLSKIVTRTGDQGTTGLATGDRVAKTHARVRALGDVDELNSQLGVLLAHGLPDAVRAPLTRIQHQLFDLGGELSMPGAVVIAEKQIEQIEADVQSLNADLPPLKEFVLPGGNAAAAACHLARAIARRAERSLWALHEAEPINPISLRFANRLSDLLFVAARVLARRDGGREVGWQRT
jgi:cob(I)alamin adenosyltransferase